MFSLLFGLWKYLFAKAEYHVLILGVDQAGKTTLLEKLKSMYADIDPLPSDRIGPTVGLNIGRVDAYKCKLIFWDLGGQVGLRSIWEKYYEEAHAVVYVIDAACPDRFEDARQALYRMCQHQDLEGAPLLVIANKQDLPAATSVEELAGVLDLKDVHERPFMLQSVSAFDGMGIREGVLWLVESVRKCPRTDAIRLKTEGGSQL